MKKILIIASIAAFASCNVSVDKQNDKDSVSKFDSAIDKVDDKLDEWGDSAKEKFKDAKQEVKARLNKDSADDKRKQ
jgi:hypothetical protein